MWNSFGNLIGGRGKKKRRKKFSINRILFTMDERKKKVGKRVDAGRQKKNSTVKAPSAITWEVLET